MGLVFPTGVIFCVLALISDNPWNRMYKTFSLRPDRRGGGKSLRARFFRILDVFVYVINNTYNDMDNACML